MISIVIRNRNEGVALEKILSILTSVYSNDYNEIIIIDNNSIDNSINIAKKFNCKIFNIDNFSYGRATNLGIEMSSSKYVLLLSSHSIPVGNSFFKNTISVLKNSNKIAGVRFINSIENYNRAVQNNFVIKEPLKYGLMTGCAIVNKEIWLDYKFNEELVFSEDKEWSQRVYDNGYEIIDMNETFFYFIKRDEKSSLRRIKNESIAKNLMYDMKPQSVTSLICSFFLKILITNNINYLKNLRYDFLLLNIKFEINKASKK